MFDTLWNTTKYPYQCHGCEAKFSVAHRLECKKGEIVTQRHDEIKFESLSPELSSYRKYATSHKSTQVVAQVLKRLKECPHQQKNEVIY